jgi:hypothetical protein
MRPASWPGRLPLSCLAPPGLEAEHGVTRALLAEGIGSRVGRFPGRHDRHCADEDGGKFSGHSDWLVPSLIVANSPGGGDRLLEASC